jgi:hypothetical protein
VEKEVTEAEWMACTDPDKMLEFLRGKASERKLRLFAVACYRHTWALVEDNRERMVAHGCNPVEVELASQEADLAWRAAPAAERFIDNAKETLNLLYWAAQENGGTGFTWTKESAAHLLRCIFGPLLFRPVSIDPAWRTWHGGLLVSMAQRMYDNRDFSDMPVLADALEEAGCDNADILGHLRGPGPHVRGCWPLDLLLGKS